MNNLFHFITPLVIGVALLAHATVQGDESAPRASDAKPDAEKKEQVKEAEPADAKAVTQAVKNLLVAVFGDNGAVPPAPAEEGNEQVVAANDAMVQQFLPTCRSIMSMDLKFIRLICADLTPDQRRTILKAAEAGAKQAAKALVAQQQRAGRGMSGGKSKNSEPYKSIRVALAKAVAERLSQEQQALLVDALAKRSAQRKLAAVLSAAAQIDDRLFLTEEQRKAILDDLNANWNDGWETWLAMSHAYGDDQFIAVPEENVVRHLNAEQKRVWKNIPKVDYGWWWGNQQGADFNVDGWWGTELENNEAQ